MIAAVADPSLLNSAYVLPPDYAAMSETAEVFTKALLLGMEPDAGSGFADVEPIEVLPYEEALAYMRKRLPVDPKTYYGMADKLRFRAFTASRLADGDAVKRVQGMLATSLGEGKGLREFLRMTEGELADAAGVGKGSGWYYETVYRTNMSTAYNVGRAVGFEEVPPIALELIGIDDSRQTEICHSLTVPPFRRPYGDPAWETLWPPFHFNCRTTVRAIYDQAEIDGAGGPDKFYSQGMPDFRPAEGFGRYPVDKNDAWWDLTDSMRERAGEYGLDVEFMEAREKLVEGPSQPEPPQPEYKPLTEKEIREFEKQSDETYKKLSSGTRETEREALANYTTGGHNSLNRFLYGTSEDPFEIQEKYRKDIALIDSAMDKFSLNRNIVAYSGTNANHYINWNVGDVKPIDGYLSTAISEQEAKKFIATTKKKGKPPLMLEVHLPKGTKCLYIGKNTDYNKGDEKELLLGHGLKYRIIGRTADRMILEVVDG